MATQRSRWYAPFIRLLRAAAYLTSHTLVALLLIGAITVVEELIHRVGDPILFGRVPLHWFFDAMDVTILLVFMVFGTIEGIRAFENEDHIDTSLAVKRLSVEIADRLFGIGDRRGVCFFGRRAIDRAAGRSNRTWRRDCARRFFITPPRGTAPGFWRGCGIGFMPERRARPQRGARSLDPRCIVVAEVGPAARGNGVDLDYSSR